MRQTLRSPACHFTPPGSFALRWLPDPVLPRHQTLRWSACQWAPCNAWIQPIFASPRPVLTGCAGYSLPCHVSGSSLQLVSASSRVQLVVWSLGGYLPFDGCLKQSSRLQASITHGQLYKSCIMKSRRSSPMICQSYLHSHWRRGKRELQGWQLNKIR